MVIALEAGQTISALPEIRNAIKEKSGDNGQKTEKVELLPANGLKIPVVNRLER
jgi:hypothetical protein